MRSDVRFSYVAHSVLSDTQGRIWGHETSQQAKSVNRAIKPQWQEVALKQSQLLWDYMMGKYFQKARIGEELTTPFPPNIMTKMRETEEKSTLLIAHPSSPSECRVTDSLGRQFLVQFEPQCKCSCGDPQDIGLPCVHVWRACTKLCKRHFDYISDFYTTSTYQQTYSKSIPTILQEDLEPDENYGEPAVRRGRGHPSEKRRLRFQPKDPVHRNRKCTVCKSTEHDKRKCPAWAAMLAQGRGQGPTLESEDEVEEDVHGLDTDTLEEETCNDELASGKLTDEESEVSESFDPDADWEFLEEARQVQKDPYISDGESEDAVALGAGLEEDVIDVDVASQPGTQASTQAGTQASTQSPNEVGQVDGSPGFFSALLRGVIDSGPTI